MDSKILVKRFYPTEEEEIEKLMNTSPWITLKDTLYVDEISSNLRNYAM
jgi:hypothetical protein